MLYCAYTVKSMSSHEKYSLNYHYYHFLMININTVVTIILFIIIIIFFIIANRSAIMIQLSFND